MNTIKTIISTTLLSAALAIGVVVGGISLHSVTAFAATEITEQPLNETDCYETSLTASSVTTPSVTSVSGEFNAIAKYTWQIGSDAIYLYLKQTVSAKWDAQYTLSSTKTHDEYATSSSSSTTCQPYHLAGYAKSSNGVTSNTKEIRGTYTTCLYAVIGQKISSTIATSANSNGGLWAHGASSGKYIQASFVYSGNAYDISNLSIPSTSSNPNIYKFSVSGKNFYIKVTSFAVDFYTDSGNTIYCNQTNTMFAFGVSSSLKDTTDTEISNVESV